MLEQVRNEAKAAALEICQVAKLRKGQILVVGCSTSEVTGHKVGSYSSPELGQAIYDGIQEALQPQGIYLAAQCCEHLNRALVMEQKVLDERRLTQVNVMPVPKAGGSTGAAAYLRFEEPAVAMAIQAEAAIDVGDTLVGMHIRPVAVPLRMPQENYKVGEAHVVMAYSRLPYIGGERAQYPKK